MEKMKGHKLKWGEREEEGEWIMERVDQLDIMGGDQIISYQWLVVDL